MEVLLSDRFRLIALLSFCAALWSVESLIPLFRYREGRLRRAFPNLILTVGLVVTNFALASLIAVLSVYVSRHGFGLLSGVRSNAWLLATLGIAGLDLSAYIAHVLLHKIPTGWKFHRVHHSEAEVDVTTAFRQHPGETIWRIFWQGVGTVALGLPLWVVSVYLSLSGLNALLEHANIRMSPALDKWLGYLMVTPGMHKVHHSRVPAQTDTNYSNIFSVWDRLCGTYTPPTNLRRIRYGLDGFDSEDRQTLSALLKTPFQP